MADREPYDEKEYRIVVRERPHESDGPFWSEREVWRNGEKLEDVSAVEVRVWTADGDVQSLFDTDSRTPAQPAPEKPDRICFLLMKPERPPDEQSQAARVRWLSPEDIYSMEGPYFEFHAWVEGQTTIKEPIVLRYNLPRMNEVKGQLEAAEEHLGRISESIKQLGESLGFVWD